MRTSTSIDGRIVKCEFRNDPIVIRINKFNEETAKAFSVAMAKAHESDQPIIPIVIDSYGGIVDSLFSMVSDIQNAEKTVATIVVGKAMSCGSVLMSMGTDGYRFIDKNARVMIHEVAAGDWGKVTDFTARADEIKRINKQLFTLMAANCGKPEDYFVKEMFNRNNADWYLTPEEAVTHGLANKIHVPSMHRKVSIDYTFG